SSCGIDRGAVASPRRMAGSRGFARACGRLHAVMRPRGWTSVGRPARSASFTPADGLHLFPLVTDPVFYLLAVPAVILLGLSKGGFAGLGTAATPLIALYLPPFEAAALLLPILICQDIISLYAYRRDWD